MERLENLKNIKEVSGIKKQTFTYFKHILFFLKEGDGNQRQDLYPKIPQKELIEKELHSHSHVLLNKFAILCDIFTFTYVVMC